MITTHLKFELDILYNKMLNDGYSISHFNQFIEDVSKMTSRADKQKGTPFFDKIFEKYLFGHKKSNCSSCIEQYIKKIELLYEYFSLKKDSGELS